MLPGEVQLKISVSMVVGPFRGSGPFADTVGSNLRSLLSDAVLRPTGEPGLGLTSFSFSFSKRGIPWKVSAFAKGTISEGDKRDLDAMLQSLRFIDGPVASDQWAAYLAWQQLPPKERKFEVCWILPHGQCGPRLVSVTKAGAAYVVTFRNSEVQNNVSTWKYRVEGMGKVTPIP
jgi:hypothetical protein